MRFSSEISSLMPISKIQEVYYFTNLNISKAGQPHNIRDGMCVCTYMCIIVIIRGLNRDKHIILYQGNCFVFKSAYHDTLIPSNTILCNIEMSYFTRTA